MTYLTLLLAGPLVGLLSAIFGVGGGIIIVPVLYSFFEKFPPQMVVACSLGTIFLISFTNFFNFLRADRKPNWKMLAVMIPLQIVGILLGGKVIGTISPQTVKIIFGAIVFSVAARLILTARDKKSTSTKIPPLSLVFLALAALCTLAGGLISGLTGLGGGAIMVPLFISILRMPLKEVPLYSNGIMGFGTLVGLFYYGKLDAPIQTGLPPMLQQFQMGMLNWGVILLLFVGAFFTSKLGIKIGQDLSPVKGKYIFAGLLFIISTRVLIRTLL